MANTQPFDYAQPTRDSLAGIYVEATDEPSAQASRVEPAGASPSEALFGLTQTVDDTTSGAPERPRDGYRR